MRKTVALAAAAWLIFTLLAGFAFFDRELWSDEAVTLLAATGHVPSEIAPGVYEPAAIEAFYVSVETGPLEVWRAAATYDNHTPGNPALISAVLWLAGAQTLHPGWLRLVNIAVSALFVFVAIPLARRLGAGNHWLPLAVIVFSPFAFYLARELRVYGLLLVLVLFVPLLCLRLKDGRMRHGLFLAAIVALNLAGCTLHKLFLGVVAAEIAFLAALALTMPERRRQFAMLAAGVAILTLLFAAPIPNLLAVTPGTSQLDALWVDAARGLVPFAEGLLRYLAYFLSWWIVPPDDPFASWAGIAFVVAFAPLALVLAAVALREAVRLRPHAPTLLFIAVPFAFLFSIHVVMGVDLSRAPRFSIIWIPFAAIWLTGRMPGLPLRRVLQTWTALAVATSSVLVLAGYAHTSPDGARGFAAALPETGAARLVWLDNGTLHAKGLLLALDSELGRAGKLPGRYEIVGAQAIASLQAEAAPPPGLIAGPRRLSTEISDACVGGEFIVEGEYAACVRR